MSFLKKIQDQPKSVRKVIFWVAVILIGAILLFGLLHSMKIRIESSRNTNPFEGFPDFKEQYESFPKIEIPPFPELTEEEKKALEEAEKQFQEEENNSSSQPVNP